MPSVVQSVGMLRHPRTFRSAAVGVALLTAVGAVGAVSACGPGGPAQVDAADDDVSPIVTGPVGDHDTSDPEPTSTTGPPAPAVGGDPSTGAPSSTTPAARAVTDVLDRYGRLLGELSADPGGAPPVGAPARTRWDALVDARSPLSEELLDRIHRRATEDRMVVLPDAHGVSFRHHLVAIESAGTDTIEFEWCGWSPGVGRSIESGAVLDDAVAHATGTGRLVLVEGAWRLAALDQLDLELLPAGSGDPCPLSDGPGT